MVPKNRNKATKPKRAIGRGFLTTATTKRSPPPAASGKETNKGPKTQPKRAGTKYGEKRKPIYCAHSRARIKPKLKATPNTPNNTPNTTKTGRNSRGMAVADMAINGRTPEISPVAMALQPQANTTAA